MIELAGLEDIAISYAHPGGDHRVANLLLRCRPGTAEETIVAVVKPVPDEPSDDSSAAEPMAVG